MVDIVEPRVDLIAYTQVAPGNPTILDDLGLDTTDRDESGGDLTAEFGGRACYQSNHRPNKYTFDTKDYLKNIIDSNHHSVLEHATATIYIQGVSRALTHELIRHRHLSPSQLSQRFVDESNLSMVVPPALEGNEKAIDALKSQVESCVDTYVELVDELTNKGLPRKQAREAGRAILPNCVETRIVLTGNMRAFRDMLGKRLDPAADKEIQRVAQMILNVLYKQNPGCLQDFAHLVTE